MGKPPSDWMAGLVSSENIHTTTPSLLPEPKGDAMLKVLSRLLGMPEPAPPMLPERLLDLAEEETRRVAKEFPQVLPVTFTVIERLEGCAAMAILKWDLTAGALAEEPWIIINNRVCSEIQEQEKFKAGVIRHELSHVLHNLRVIEAAGAKPGDPPPVNTEHTPEWEAVARELGVMPLDPQGRLSGYDSGLLGVPAATEGTHASRLLFDMGVKVLGLDPRLYSKRLGIRALRP